MDATFNLNNYTDKEVLELFGITDGPLSPPTIRL